MSSNSSIDSDEEVSTIATSGREYEVFLSFRGPDTRDLFADHLYVRLSDTGIRVYRDDEEIPKGEEIGRELLTAIRKSKIAIPIFSKRYAESKWCLRELVEIAKCRRSSGLKVLPIFYDVTPSEVRNQTANYANAFESFEGRYDEDTIKSWRAALREVGELKGWDFNGDSRGEGELVRSIVQHVHHILRRKQLHVADHPVMLEDYVNLIASKLAEEPMVGLCGLGGVGKTTIAKAVFNHMLHSFDGVCFLANVRENPGMSGLVKLQKILLREVLEDTNFHINHVDEGIGIIKRRLGQKKILVVVDNVDDLDQLRKLVGDYRWFGSGSRVIITTRNEHLLISHGVNFIHEVSCLDDRHARKLFVWYAFRDISQSEEFKGPIHWVVDNLYHINLC